MDWERDPGDPLSPDPESADADADADADPVGGTRSDAPAEGADLGFPIVALGASAGGLAALEGFFAHLPLRSGLAFVVVTHQHAGHTNMLPELLDRRTAMPVSEAAEGLEVEPNHVYVSPPGAKLGLRAGRFVIDPDAAEREGPIDHFFKSLALDAQARAVGIVLSGSGSDGTQGVKAIKAADGWVLAQDAESAQFGGMPDSAVATGAVDWAGPVEELPWKLLSCLDRRALDLEDLPPPSVDPELLSPKLFGLLRDHTGHDFSRYKRSTIVRRVQRRMRLHGLSSPDDYLAYLQNHPAEVDSLLGDLLISVTSFFRDPAAFEALLDALPGLFIGKPADHVLRVWVAGCATGEEAYSLGILLTEWLEREGRPQRVQIFATDIDGQAVAAARVGWFPLSVAESLSPARLERFFRKVQAGYLVRPELRDMIVFATQSVIGDPPFTRLDLLSCRNLLIYLDAGLQRQLIPMFHYALRPRGLMLLGTSEGVGSFDDLFEPVDKSLKLFRRREGQPGTRPELPSLPATAGGNRPRRPVLPRSFAASLPRLIERFLLRELVPPSLLVNQRGDVIHVHGKTGDYLEPSQGQPGHANVYNMLRPGLERSVQLAVEEAVAGAGEVVRRVVPGLASGRRSRVELRVKQLTQPEPLSGLMLISFEDLGDPASKPQLAAEPGEVERIAELERELSHVRENQQVTLEELEISNEELQSANEELETSKEELYSLNEELQTVNSELEAKVEALTRANGDMQNLLDGTRIATIYLDKDLRVNRFNEQAREALRLIPSDAGRAVGDLAHQLRYDRLEADAREVRDTLALKETLVQGERAMFLMRILPYRTSENLIDGLVITLVDVSEIGWVHPGDRLEQALSGSSTSVCGLDHELRHTWCVGAELFGLGPSQLLGKTDAELLPADQAQALSRLGQEVLDHEQPARDRIELTLAGRTLTYEVHMQPDADDRQGPERGLLAVYTELTASEEAVS